MHTQPAVPEDGVSRVCASAPAGLLRRCQLEQLPAVASATTLRRGARYGSMEPALAALRGVAATPTAGIVSKLRPLKTIGLMPSTDGADRGRQIRCMSARPVLRFSEIPPTMSADSRSDDCREEPTSWASSTCPQIRDRRSQVVAIPSCPRGHPTTGTSQDSSEDSRASSQIVAQRPVPADTSRRNNSYEAEGQTSLCFIFDNPSPLRDSRRSCRLKDLKRLKTTRGPSRTRGSVHAKSASTLGSSRTRGSQLLAVANFVQCLASRWN